MTWDMETLMSKTPIPRYPLQIWINWPQRAFALLMPTAHQGFVPPVDMPFLRAPIIGEGNSVL